MAKLTGAAIMARALKDQGVDYMFGIVGFPVQPIAREAQKAGIKYYGCRNEQAASYAAGAVGYMTGRPGACLVVSGPGVVHGLSGLSNAKENCWPMILIGGASPVRQNGMGAFQEERGVLIATPFCKFAHAVEHPYRIPFYVEMAVRNCIYGRPGAAYLDMPDDIILGEAEEDTVRFPGRCADPPRIAAPQEYIEQALDVLKSAQRPLVIVGKGMAWSGAEEEVQAFMTQVVLAEGPGPFYAIGHSTGGNILIRSLSKHKWFAKAVAVSPLLGLHYPGWPLAAVRMVLFLALSAGLGRARLPGYPDRSMSREDFPDNPLTSDQRRFNRDIATLDAAPHLGLGAPSFAWLKAARRSMARLAALNPKKNLTCPLLMVGAGLDRVVDNEATRRFAGRMPGVSLVTIHEAEHEILNERDEIREQFFAIFDTYIGGSDIA